MSMCSIRRAMRLPRSLLALTTVLFLPFWPAAAAINTSAGSSSGFALSAFPLDPAQAALSLNATRNFTLAVAARLDKIIKARFFPQQKREEGMTQQEFEAAAKGMMAALSRDDLYTAGVSSRPGAVKPSFDWPWSRNFPLSDQLYAHLGWQRRNKTQWAETEPYKEFGASWWIDRRPQLLGEWRDDLPAECANDTLWKRSWFDRPSFEFCDPDGIEITYCAGAPPAGTALPALPKTRRRLTLCVHVVLSLDHLKLRLRSEWLAAYLRYYTVIGVEHVYLYVSRIPFVDVPGFSYDWIDVSWMHTFKHLVNGQLWAINDCLLRNHEQGNAWALFADVDELLVLPGVQGGLQALVTQLEEQKYESANFHSVPYLPNHCDVEAEGGAAVEGGGVRRKGLVERMVFRAVFPELCDDIWQRACSFNNEFAVGGRRKAREDHPALRPPARPSVGLKATKGESDVFKVLVKVESAPSVEIHSLSMFWHDEEEVYLQRARPGVRKGDFKEKMRAMNASRVWIKHIRGVGFEDVTAHDRDRLLCSGLPEGSCEHTPSGVHCRKKDLGKAGALNPSSEWTDERPYVLRALGLGDALAGSYETDNFK